MEEVDNSLVMKLYVDNGNTGFINGGSNLLSTATITKQDAYSLKGGWDGWAKDVYFKKTDVADYLYAELNLDAKTYEFKYLDNGEWRGYSGTITDKTSSAVTFKNTVSANAKLKASGGNYVFKLNASASSIEVSYNQ